MKIDSEVVSQLDGELERDLQADGRLGKTHRYLLGQHDLPYMPRGCKQEYRHLAKRAITNWLPLVSDTYTKGLFVDGIRTGTAGENSPAWRYWQANGMDARQSVIHRGALEYGTSFLMVLPGEKPDMPVMRPCSPLATNAWYEDDDAEFPVVALRRKGETMDGTRLVEVLDENKIYTYELGPHSGPDWKRVATDEHGMGVTPLVRFRDRLDGEAQGIIAPLIPANDRINEIVFATLIAMQFASFRQRWATGLAIPFDEETGEPIQPFEAAIDRLWVTDSENAKFGDFAQTEVQGHLSFYASSVRTLAAAAQISPNILTGDLVNLSAEALAQMERQTQGKIEEFETIFGESWETGFRLASLAAGDTAGANDTESQVRWRDTEARSFAATVDGLGKLAQMLQVPAEGLWEKVPGVTDQDIARWRTLAEQNDLLTALMGGFERQETPTVNVNAMPNAPEVEKTATGERTDLSERGRK